VQIIAQWQRSVALREDLVMLYWEMRAESQQRICMVIILASKPRVLFFIVN
jgi:hypothetical protein